MHLTRTLGSNFALAVMVILSGFPAGVVASEYLSDENTAPESADDLATSFEHAIEPEPVEEVPRWRVLKRFLQNRGPFWRDSSLTFKSRTYLFDRELDEASISEALATGGELTFESGLWRDTLRLGASWYGSFDIDAPEDKDGTGLLGSGQTDLSVLGRLYLDLEWNSVTARLYRQDLSIPYLNRQDSRMIPNTHEGYILMRDGMQLEFLAGHITRMKTRDSEEFVELARIAGVDDSDNGATVLGARWAPTESFDVGAMSLYTRDLFNTFYAETSWRRQIGESMSWQAALQFTDQRSVGSALLGDFSTRHVGIRGAWGYRNAILKLAYTRTGDGAGIRSPYGGRPGFTSMMLLDFDFAEQRSLMAALSFNFARVGAEGLSAEIKFARGSDGIDPSSGATNLDQEELDITIDYRPKTGPLTGLWARIRHAETDSGMPNGDLRDFRVILNYELAFH